MSTLVDTEQIRVIFEGRRDRTPKRAIPTHSVKEHEFWAVRIFVGFARIAIAMENHA
jgi:hypothetical protein